MKRKPFLSALLLLTSLLLPSCNKFPPINLPGNNVPKGMLLKEWRTTSTLVPERSYFFYYNKRNAIDSIRGADVGGISYVYRVKYKSNGHIDNVTTVESSGHVSTFADNYTYDQNGLVTHYDYNYSDHFGNTGTIPVDLIHSNGTLTIKYNTIVHSFTFNGQLDVIHMKDNGDRPFDGTFNYDHGLNPLFYVKDFYVIAIEEVHYLYEYVLPKHNFIRKNYNDGYNIVYKNTYDQRNRLIQKDFTDERFKGKQSFYYTYY